MTTRMHWTDDAACRGLDIEMFYASSREDTEAALAVCAVCPVRAECLREAMAVEQAHRFGIFGGMTAKQRKRAAIELKRASMTCALCCGPLPEGATVRRVFCDSCQVTRARTKAVDRDRRHRLAKATHERHPAAA